MLARIKDDVKKAMKAGEKHKVTTLRMLISDIHKEEIAKRSELEEPELLAIISRAVKSRKDSITEFAKGGREDLVEKETKELEILQDYLPEPLSEEEIGIAIDELISELGAEGMKDFGRVMKEMMTRHQGRVDGKTIKELIQAKLSG